MQRTTCPSTMATRHRRAHRRAQAEEGKRDAAEEGESQREASRKGGESEGKKTPRVEIFIDEGVRTRSSDSVRFLLTKTTRCEKNPRTTRDEREEKEEETLREEAAREAALLRWNPAQAWAGVVRGQWNSHGS